MAENPTTDSASTTAAPSPVPDANAPNPTPDSSTTAQPEASPKPADAEPPSPEAPPAGDDEGGEDTILTPKPDADKPTPEEEARAALFGAPEGDYELTGLPEGTVIDTETLAVVAPIAKELGLSNEGLSKLAAPFAEKIVPHIADQVTQQILASHAATTKGWADETIEAVKTDPAFAGKPLPEVQQVAAKALDRFGGTEFRQYLADTGLGNHPAMVKAMFLAGSAIAEDTTFERGNNAPAPKTREEKFYPKKSTA